MKIPNNLCFIVFYFSSSTREEISDVLSQIDAEMRDALKVRRYRRCKSDKKEIQYVLFGQVTLTFFSQVFDKKQKTSQYEEANSFSSDDPVEDDPVKIAHKGQ